jgi:pectate lyase
MGRHVGAILLGLALVGCTPAATPLVSASPTAAPVASPSVATRDIGRETLAPNDGWAAATTGTTGGAKADAAHVVTVTDRARLVSALGDGNDATPRIVYVSGTIDGNVDDAGKALRCDDYATGGYSLDAYLKAFDPATYGRTKRPAGPLEDARAASEKKQGDRMQVRVGPNTTIVGLAGARLLGIDLVIDKVDNVIVRNLTLVDAYDCFPQWDPTDGAQGNWNAQFDNISLKGATHVWVDHCSFTDGDRPDAKQPSYLGRPYQVHDGQLDITNASDLVTVSWNRFTDHDKVMLIGSSDTGNTAAADQGKLNVTVHHNVFQNVGQRAPRVRFGKVHVYNNLYDIGSAQGYTYSWGVGVDSRIYAENNHFRFGGGTSIDRVIRPFGGKAIYAAGSAVTGGAADQVADLLAAYNAANEAKLSADVGWKPTLIARPVEPAGEVAKALERDAGPTIR